MRVLGIGDGNELAAMYSGMVARGHDVKVYVRESNSHGVFANLLTRTPDWERELGWIRDAGEEGFIVFETANQGAAQDSLRADGFQVVGGSELGDQLEADREFGQAVLGQTGLRIARSHSFVDYRAAAAFIAARRNRYVLKFNGAGSPRTRNYIAQKADSSDLASLLGYYATTEPCPPEAGFVLMEYVEGVEIGIGGYFNGAEFLDTACVDFEHKRFFPGDLGELTGEMGTVVTYAGSQKLLDRVLKPLTSVLREGKYCGYINVNLIANADGLWPLEFTSRFGYPGYAICERLHREPWEHIFRKLMHRSERGFAVTPHYAVGIVLTVPPFPYTHGYEKISKGLPILFDSSISAEERAAIAFAEVEMREGCLITSGGGGYLGVVTGCAPTISEARVLALSLARKVYVPNIRYREDIGNRVTKSVLEELGQWGYL